MAYIRKSRGKWRAEVERNGTRKSRTFETKSAATQWAAAEEAEILAVKRGAFPNKTLGDALKRYMEEESPRKKSVRPERFRLEALIRDFPALAAKRLTEVTTPDMAGWRDARLKVVTRGSVQRDLNILSNVFTTARDEWKWCPESPLKGMRAPGDNPPRDRRPTPMEIRRICRWLGYKSGQRQATKMAETALAFLVSLRTGMRQSEVLSLSSETVDLKRRVATIRSHKTLHLTGKPREVPLSRQAARLLAPCLPGSVFTVSAPSLDAFFRKARQSLLIPDLHFHDARGDALTRLSKKVDVLTLARISGHRDLRVLLNSYYRESAEDIAARLG